MDAAHLGNLGGTYGGNPLGIAAAHAVMDVIEDEVPCTRTNELGSHLKKRLESILARTPEIVNIRGPGLLDAAKFNTADESLQGSESHMAHFFPIGNFCPYRRLVPGLRP